MNEDQEPMLAGMEPVVVEVPPAEDEEAARKRARELDDALYAALVSRAHSDQAKVLVDTVTALVCQRELAANSRTRRRGKARTAALRTAIERYLADLLQAHSVERPKGYVYRSTRPDGFKGGAVSYRTFTAVVGAMVGLRLLEVYKGYQVRTTAFDIPIVQNQKATRYRAIWRLLDISQEHGVPAIDFHQYFIVPPPEHPLQLRATSKRTDHGTKIDGKILRFERTPATKELEEQLRNLNKFLLGFDLQGGIHRGYIRLFQQWRPSKVQLEYGRSALRP